MKDNDLILKERTKAFNQVPGPRVGDYLLMPYDLLTRFTHKWDESIQTGGGSSSYYLGHGYLSYSGGLDPGVKLSDIEKTDQVKAGNVWFFDKDISGAGRGVHFNIDFRVFKLKGGAETSGLWQIKEYEKQMIRDKAEKVTRINGNGQPYTLPLPEVHIQQDFLNEIVLDHIFQNCWLKFQKSGWGYFVQPMTHEQLTTLLLTYNFECHYYNNATHSNQLRLTFAKDKNK